VCTPRCGNGVTEAPELCDDGNADACGSCNASCGGLNPLPITGCPLEAGCALDTDCASGDCEDRECVE
jgi:cysteine-rich repeat protein